MKPGDMIDAYIKLRDRKKEITDRHSEELKPYNDALKRIEGELLRVMNTDNLTNLKAEAGTAYITTRSTAKVADWGQFIEFVKAHDCYHMLEHRASKTAVEEFLEENQSLPPGISITRDTAVNIRRD